jgi:hypothetical protein
MSAPWKARRDRAGAHWKPGPSGFDRNGTAGFGARASGRDSGEGAQNHCLDGVSHDGFHATVARGNREDEPRQRAGRCVDASLVHRAAQRLRPLLVLTDGWAAYPGSIRRAFRHKVKKLVGVGRACLEVWPHLCIGTVIKRTPLRAPGSPRLSSGEEWRSLFRGCGMGIC